MRVGAAALMRRRGRRRWEAASLAAEALRACVPGRRHLRGRRGALDRRAALGESRGV